MSMAVVNDDVGFERYFLWYSVWAGALRLSGVGVGLIVTWIKMNGSSMSNLSFWRNVKKGFGLGVEPPSSCSRTMWTNACPGEQHVD